MITEIQKIRKIIEQQGKQIRIYLMANFEFFDSFSNNKKSCLWCDDFNSENKFKNVFDWFLIKKSIFVQKCFDTLFKFLMSDILSKENEFFVIGTNERDNFIQWIEKHCFKLKFINKENGKGEQLKDPSFKEKVKFQSKFILNEVQKNNPIREIQKLWYAVNETLKILEIGNLEHLKQYELISEKILNIKVVYGKFYSKKHKTPFIHFLFEHLEKLCCPKFTKLLSFFLNYELLNPTLFLENDQFFQKNQAKLLKKLNRIEYLKFMKSV